MRRPRALLFDLDGVLIESQEVWFRLQSALATSLGGPPFDRERFRESFGQGVEDDVRSFYPQTTVAEVEAYYRAHFMEHLEHLTVMPGAPELFEALRRAGCPTAVVTNSPTPLARRLLAQAWLAPDVLVGASDVARPKPAPDMVLRAAELLGVPVEATAVIGDSRYDRAAARAAGAVFVGFRIDGDLRVERLDEVATLVRAT